SYHQRGYFADSEVDFIDCPPNPLFNVEKSLRSKTGAEEFNHGFLNSFRKSPSAQLPPPEFQEVVDYIIQKVSSNVQDMITTAVDQLTNTINGYKEKKDTGIAIFDATSKEESQVPIKEGQVYVGLIQGQPTYISKTKIATILQMTKESLQWKIEQLSIIILGDLSNLWLQLPKGINQDNKAMLYPDCVVESIVNIINDYDQQNRASSSSDVSPLLLTSSTVRDKLKRVLHSHRTLKSKKGLKSSSTENEMANHSESESEESKEHGEHMAKKPKLY
ncbi:Sphingosine N-acyltransferase lac1, partial [Frankliniella fusca]